MLFNTISFWLFFAALLPAYLLLRRRRPQNLLLLVGSYYFYACWDWRFLGLLLLSSTVDWNLANAIKRESTPRGAKRWVAASVVVNLTFLGFFKYFNFFVDSANVLLTSIGAAALTTHLSVILPVGISFYTFQSISYIVDVYRGEVEPARDPIDFALFVAFFPHMVAGPIMHSRDLLPQMQSERRPRWSEMQRGFHLAMWGLFKKVVVADNLALVAADVFDGKMSLAPGVVHLGVLAFAFQIYCDFSGYTDIARGLARIMGFRLMDNFHHPYFATSITDFWRRWHISLSTWLRDYLYIPLGGNRGSRLTTYRNLAITMLLGGLWHGAAWHFVLWGAYQGLLLIVERVVAGRRILADLREARTAPALAVLLARVLFTFHLVGLGWILFRAQHMDVLRRMSLLYADPRGWFQMPHDLGVTVLLFIVPVLLVDIAQFVRRDEYVLLRVPTPLRAMVYAAGFYAFVLFGQFESNAFIYFQF